MIFYIDEKRQPENHFWNCLHGIASEVQIKRILAGYPLLIGGIKYQIVFLDEENDECS